MTLNEIFRGLGHLFTDLLFLPFESMGNMFNTVLLLTGSFGFLYWMRKQAKFNKQAKTDPNQLK